MSQQRQAMSIIALLSLGMVLALFLGYFFGVGQAGSVEAPVPKEPTELEEAGIRPQESSQDEIEALRKRIAKLEASLATEQQLRGQSAQKLAKALKKADRYDLIREMLVQESIGIFGNVSAISYDAQTFAVSDGLRDLLGLDDHTFDQLNQINARTLRRLQEWETANAKTVDFSENKLILELPRLPQDALEQYVVELEEVMSRQDAELVGALSKSLFRPFSVDRRMEFSMSDDDTIRLQVSNVNESDPIQLDFSVQSSVFNGDQTLSGRWDHLIDMIDEPHGH
ncbi:MAG: hypothetical protein AAFX93_11790 [Verrucomicrobiota bacterium]